MATRINQHKVIIDVWNTGNNNRKKLLEKDRLLIFDFANDCIEEYKKKVGSVR